MALASKNSPLKKIIDKDSNRVQTQSSIIDSKKNEILNILTKKNPDKKSKNNGGSKKYSESYRSKEGDEFMKILSKYYILN